jgi:hypothetical protein
MNRRIQTGGVLGGNLTVLSQKRSSELMILTNVPKSTGLQI